MLSRRLRRRRGRLRGGLGSRPLTKLKRTGERVIGIGCFVWDGMGWTVWYNIRGFGDVCMVGS